MQRRRRQFSDNPAIETPEDDAHTFNERYKVGRAAHACLCSHGTHASNSGSDSAKVHMPCTTFSHLRKERVTSTDVVGRTQVCPLLNRRPEGSAARLPFRGHQYERRNDIDCCTDCVFAWWRRLVLGPRPRITRPVRDPKNQPYPKTDSRLRGRAKVPDGGVNRRFNRGGLYESVRLGLLLLAQAVQLPHHDARQAASH